MKQQLQDIKNMIFKINENNIKTIALYITESLAVLGLSLLFPVVTIFGAVFSIGILIKLINNERKNDKVRKKKLNVTGHKSSLYDLGAEIKIDNGYRVNLLFKKNNYIKSSIISSTVKDISYFFPEQLDELEYTVLTEISESEADWDNIPYCTVEEEMSQGRRKKRTNNIPSIETKKPVLFNREYVDDNIGLCN